ncbi:MAG: LytTR family DNA-binding domain-containing protein [Ferruginibacter sp.]
MLKVLIIEDEKPALEGLLLKLESLNLDIDVIAATSSIHETIQWLNHNRQPDLIIMDIHLTDGLSFGIFEATNITVPVIFLTAYDEFIIKAFEYNAIDYILKPVDDSRLMEAVKKYYFLQKHFIGNYSALVSSIKEKNQKRNRIIIRKGMEFQSIKADDIACFYTEHKLIFSIDKDSKKFLTEARNLSELIEELDEHTFFRVNRKYIVNVNYIKRFIPSEKSKVVIDLTIPVNDEIVVSQENSAEFKKWMNAI